MRRKTKYSLTAAQRKQQRKDQLKEERKGLSPEEMTEAEKSEASAAETKRKQKKSLITRITAMTLAIVLAVGAIVSGIVLIVIGNKEVDNDKVNPIATIVIANSKGEEIDKIEIELLFKESATYKDKKVGIFNKKVIDTDGRSPVANFIYLAENKFFDNTLFSNTIKGFLAFEGYTEETDPDFGWFKHKGKYQDYVENLPGFSGNTTKTDPSIGSIRSNIWGQPGYKLGYRLNYKSPVTVGSDKKGYLAMLSRTGSTRGTSTGFIMTYNAGPQLVMSGNLLTDYITYIGKMNQESIDVLNKIAGMATVPNEKITDWAYPQDYKNAMIKSVRITKLNKKLRDNIVNNFEDFVIWGNSEMEGAIKGYSSWPNTANAYLKKI